jgi:hypothetical protein
LGADEAASLNSGFDTGVRMDLRVLEDSLLDGPRHCMMMQMNFDDGRESRQMWTLGRNTGSSIASNTC